MFIRASGGRLTTLSLVCEWTFGKHVGQIQDTALLAKTLKVGIISSSTRPCYVWLTSVEENPRQVYFVAQILYKVNIGLTKISILLLYLRIFITQWFQRTCQVSIAIIVAFTIGTVISSIFQCTPVAFAFDKTEKGTCIDLTAFWYANAAFNILSDIAIILLPVSVIKKLQLSPQQKLLLCGIFAVGILCVCFL